MKSLFILFAIAGSCLVVTSCGLGNSMKKMHQKSDQQFGDQHFKTAISLIELHKVRYGHYPESLDSLKHTGAWDAIIHGSVQYTRVDTLYDLDLVMGFTGKPKRMNYPADFWQGLGLRKSNMR